MNYSYLNTLGLKLFRSSFFLLLLSIISQKIYAQDIAQITREDKIWNVGKKVLYLIDPSGKMTLEEVLKQDKLGGFQKNNQDIFARPASRKAYWFKLIVSNKSGEDIWLEVSNSQNAWSVKTYELKPGDKEPTIVSRLGVLESQLNNGLPSNRYNVKLTPRDYSQPTTYYIRVACFNPILCSFKVGKTKKFMVYLNYYYLGKSAFLAIILAMFVYNLFLFFSTKDRLYFIYIAYLLTLIFNITFYVGAPLINNVWITKNLYAWHGIMFLFTALFSIEYLNLKVLAPRLRIWILMQTFVIVVVFGVLNLFFLSNEKLYSPFDVTSLVFYITLLSTGIYVWVKGNKNARFYVIAWIFVFAGAVMFIGTSNGVIPLNEFTRQSMYLGFALETLLFALALGDRFNTLKKEKERAQTRNLNLVKKQNETLEKKVSERTNELQEANEELQVMNEELVQSQEELAAQRDQLNEQNKILSRKNTQIESSVKVAKSIQQAVLPYQRKLDHLLKEYFVINRPKDVVSGDFYWLNEVGNRTLLVAADCTGHGIPGAFMTLIGVNLLDKIVRVWGINEPNEVLEKLHEEIQTVLKQQTTRNRSGMDAVVLSLQRNEQTTFIKFAGAKNSIFYINESRGGIEEIKGTRKSIGGMSANQPEFVQTEINFDSGTMIYFGSDGLSDQNNKARKAFGKKRLKKVLCDVANLPVLEQQQTIERTLDEYMRDTTQRDDILWMGVKV